MQPWDLLASEGVQGFIEEALSRKWDALQVSTALNKQGYSNEERAAIMDYMALVPKFREKFANKETARGMFLLETLLSRMRRIGRAIRQYGNSLTPTYLPVRRPKE